MSLTNRVRRIKCDETLPHCRRCTETGRKCEGPAVRQLQFIHGRQDGRSANPIPQVEASRALVPPRAQAERRAFQYFMCSAAPVLTGAVDARFWKELVPQLAQTDSFVWDSVVCLSILYEHVPYTSVSSFAGPLLSTTQVVNRQHRQALGFYSRAIASLRRLAERDQIDESVVALSYILFSCVEFQQGNVKAGRELLKRCCNVSIENLRPNRRYSPESVAGQVVHQVVTPFVLRKAVVTATLGYALQLQCPANNEASDILDATLSRSPMLRASRTQFYSLVNDCFELIRLAEFMPHIPDNSTVNVSFTSARHSLLNKLLDWKATFTAAMSPAPDAEVDWMASFLLMYWAVCYISLATCISNRQTLFDNYMEQFTEIIDHARVYLKQSSDSSRIHLLASVDPGVIPPLYFCAMKCRDPVLRRRAQRLMREAPPPCQGGIEWAFVEPDRVLSRIISLEEGEDHESSPSSRTSSASNAAQAGLLPPEERRFAFVAVVARPAAGGKHRQALELSRFETAADGSRRLISDFAWLDEPGSESDGGLA
ncbi:uncharacterized protein A1O9_00991 [Exophiala aquamarina CBS 119918]|uniref:Zn(2)-C6 fungal-type domain-containing protein n=1 Tax=Exophiala aquamarina CBS 119918 TaxID=1182545 RepID=A0A072PT13_9EURO|nr:uncharacterized protein A1O9_00991 [Exophiala aquamarina CBS 119918]KEF63016.1 hypothetical protein A1O9_00991 [Exophiala aquamarina CBS 119918]